MNGLRPERYLKERGKKKRKRKKSGERKK